MKLPSVKLKFGIPPDFGVGGRPVKPSWLMRSPPSAARGYVVVNVEKEKPVRNSLISVRDTKKLYEPARFRTSVIFENVPFRVLYPAVPSVPMLSTSLWLYRANNLCR